MYPNTAPWKIRTLSYINGNKTRIFRLLFQRELRLSDNFPLTFVDDLSVADIVNVVNDFSNEDVVAQGQRDSCALSTFLMKI